MEENLIIPVYLNQGMVFDLLAMIQDGISTITRVSSSEEIKQEEKQKYGAKFGLNAALSSLLKIDVSGEQEKGGEKAAGIHRSEERVHTPASLLFKLREILVKEKKLKTFEEGYSPLPGHIIEFKTSLRKNPLIQAMEIMISLVNIGSVFVSDEPKKSGAKRTGTTGTSDIQTTKKQMEKFLEGLKTGDSIDIIGDKLEGTYSSVIILEKEYLNDPTMSDLVDGQFSVIGKIIRVIPDANNSISLIRKSSISAMPSELLLKSFEGFNKIEGFTIPQVELEIKGPVIQVLPIAIFT